MKNIIYKELSYTLVGLFYKTQDVLGRYAREKHYGDILEKFLQEHAIPYTREAALSKTGNDTNRADFIIDNSIILELEAKPFITREDYYQLKRYLEIENMFLGMIINFRQKYLKPKRIINSQHRR